MDLMAYWRWDNYVRDLDEGAGFHFNSNQERLHSEIEIGERLWLITGRRGYKGIQYLLVACLQVSAKTHTPPPPDINMGVIGFGETLTTQVIILQKGPI